MILGIGTDITDVSRIAAKLAKGDGFRNLVFTPFEIAYCEKQAVPAQSYAARFAAKEAFLKALGTGWGNGGVNFDEIEIRNNDAGQPAIILLGKAAGRYEELGIRKIWVSLSHEHNAAVAMVVLEG
ncbi:holo-[acyl-carrier protein] synthase [Chitinophaga terrae (ex Kim and Jung 2007)]|uniref:Holo-[acyl-carrier-protein] synthase n=1 Tax=Chitinophaga terrae (ex Kim and Jung 2007) TaxID=408074 RepID=A0A1H3ZWA2_9BACT|nr:holo-ACP synthase [Chitinophaga terrae (ex Kim and Jung 2007)]MDQ0106160.1 holo-[acyl-carrier protein] synthase [Chitinophaga terrae (ex Kim and Jung 2007)]GEP93139.1 holo-[acyl-carrier-protein] synthase [Chitinophaga terrae (ex Kim and Jung 2007)]SEA27935.1 holo-[acyl-carrier protein] synthase [Chitinophaga terrae (ex Kim and Jung 2007)]